MPDFEIRYYSTENKLALVHMHSTETRMEARDFARQNLGDFARYEIIDRDAEPSSAS